MSRKFHQKNGMLGVMSLRQASVALSACMLVFLLGCGHGGIAVPVEIEFGPNERAMVNRLLNQVDKGIETFDIRGKQAIDVFGQLPADLGKEGATLIEFQLTEWGSAMFGKGVVAVDCAAEGAQQRCIKNLEMVKEALRRAVKKVNDLENDKTSNKEEKKSKWATFLGELRFEPVLLDPHICFLDHESVKLQYTDATATAVVMRLPSDGLLKARGTGLYAPRPTPDSAAPREPTFTVWVVAVNGSKEAGRKDISSCVRYTLDNTIQLDLNAVKDKIGPADSYIEIVTKADPTKKVEIGGRNQIPFVYLDPPAPTTPPQARVVSLVVGGRTEGDNKDPNRGFDVEVYANGSQVGSMPDYCFGPGIKDADFPPERFSNRNASEREVNFGFAKLKVPVPARLFKEFPVPTTGRMWVKASEHHDCECWFTLTYTIQTYTWGSYNRATKSFPVLPAQPFDRKYTSPKWFFRGDEAAGTVSWDFTWEGP